MSPPVTAAVAPPITAPRIAPWSVPAATAPDSGSYDVVVTDSCGTATSAAAVLTVLGAPQITEDPADQAVCEGDPVTFTVTAMGAEPISYQWRKDGIDIIV